MECLSACFHSPPPPEPEPEPEPKPKAPPAQTEKQAAEERKRAAEYWNNPTHVEEAEHAEEVANAKHEREDKEAFFHTWDKWAWAMMLRGGNNGPGHGVGL